MTGSALGFDFTALPPSITFWMQNAKQAINQSSQSGKKNTINTDAKQPNAQHFTAENQNFSFCRHFTRGYATQRNATQRFLFFFFLCLFPHRRVAAPIQERWRGGATSTTSHFLAKNRTTRTNTHLAFIDLETRSIFYYFFVIICFLIFFS